MGDATVKETLARLFLFIAMTGASAEAAMVLPVDQDALETSQLIDFSGSGSIFIDGILNHYSGATFAERFDGQSVTLTGVPSRPFEILSPTASIPLSLRVGERNNNLFLSPFGGGPDERALYGATTNSVGEGSIAVLFDVDQVGLAFDFADSNGGPIYLHFFARDGRLLDSVTMHEPGDPLPNPGFIHAEGKREIAGFSISNENLGGIGIDNLRFGVPVPEPWSISIWMMLALLGAVSYEFLSQVKLCVRIKGVRKTL